MKNLVPHVKHSNYFCIQSPQRKKRKLSNTHDNYSLFHQLAAKEMADSYIDTSSVPPYKFVDDCKKVIDKITNLSTDSNLKMLDNQINLQNLRIEMDLPTWTEQEESVYRGHPKKEAEESKYHENISKIKKLLYHFIKKPSLMDPLKALFKKQRINPIDISYHSQNIYTPCVFKNCKGHLIVDNKKAEALLFDHKEGPVHARTSSRKCNKCNAQYRNGMVITETSTCIFDPRNRDVFEGSRETILTEKLMHLFGMMSIGEGNGAKSYTDHYFEQFKEEISALTDIQIGTRKKGKCKKLSPRLLSDCFYYHACLKLIFMHGLQKNHEQHPNLDIPHIYIKNEDLRILKLKYNWKIDLLSKKKKFNYTKFGGKCINTVIPEWEINEEKWNVIEFNDPIGDNNGTVYGRKYVDNPKSKEHHYYIIVPEKLCDENQNQETKTLLTNHDTYFRHIYHKYLKQKIWELPNSIASVIPVDKKGIPLVKAQQMYGDGNRKICNILCNMVNKLLMLLNFQKRKKLSTLQKTQSESYQCDCSPYYGNGKTIGTTLCIEHYLHLLMRTSLKKNEINKFVKYFNIKDNLENSTSDKKKDVLQKKLSKFKDDSIEKFKKIFDKLEQLTYQEEYRILIGSSSSKIQSLEELRKTFGCKTHIKHSTKYGKYIYIYTCCFFFFFFLSNMVNVYIYI